MNLPILLWFDDYHELDYVGNYIKKIIPDIRWTELNSEVKEKYNLEGDGFYCGLYYLKNNKPRQNEYTTISKKEI